MSYDLLNVPNGYKTELALIIAPYFDLQFAERLIKTMRPRASFDFFSTTVPVAKMLVNSPESGV